MNISYPLFLGAAASCLIAPALAEPPAEKSARELVQRIAPQASGHISFKHDAKATNIRIENNKGKIQITAANARQLVIGFGYYARHIAGAHWSWNGDRLPEKWALPTHKIEFELPWEKCFAYNYCTLSYTSAFWGWERWERELDFLALQGYDHVLVQAGLEKVWALFLKELGYPQEKIAQFIPNPAFAAWWNMGNLEGHGGPLTPQLIEGEAKLARQIATRLRELGMVPVLQGYVGFLPHDIAEHVEGLSLVPQGKWCGFTRSTVQDPTAPAFEKLAALWYQKLHEVYGGATSAYGGDLFHEGGSHGNIKIREAASAVEAAMQKASPQCNWVLQCWGGNPHAELLRGLNKEHCFVLKLDRNMHAPASHSRSFENVPWLWSELSNFGGNNTGMYGGIPALCTLPSRLKANTTPHLQGLALLSEGTEQNPAHYDLFHEMFTRPVDVELKEWLGQYSKRRYGSSASEILQAWKILCQTVYAPTREQEGCYEGIICARPSWGVKKASTWSSGDFYYDATATPRALKLMLQAIDKEPQLTKNEGIRYDVVDITRQLLSDYCLLLLPEIQKDFEAKRGEAYQEKSMRFLLALKTMDELLATEPTTLLGTSIARARAKGKTEAEKDLMERAARMLVTTWSPNISGLNDYSNRHWAGLVKDYYLPRWYMFFQAQYYVLTAKQTQSGANSILQEKLNEHDLGFAKAKETYASIAKGDSFTLAQDCLEHFGAELEQLAKKAALTQGFKWNLAQRPQGESNFRYNVSDIVTSAGDYEVRLEYKAGSSALRSKAVRLYEGQKLVAEDTHEGWSGDKHENNVYRLSLPKYREQLDDYTLELEAEGVSSPNSEGILTITPL